MPEAMERALRKAARKKFPGDKKRQERYTYGAMVNSGWRPGEGSGEHYEPEDKHKK